MVNYIVKLLNKIINSTNSLKERGPDCSTTIFNSKGYYHFSRLAINDTTIYGNQPMRNRDVYMMCNGEIYNCNSLIEKFELSCISHSDCEPIIKLYEKIGMVECIKNLYGVYAIVLTDGDKCFFVRDRIGVRPLYMGYTQENYLAVGSTAACLLPFCNQVQQVPPGVLYCYDKSTKELKIIYTDNSLLLFPIFREQTQIQSTLKELLFRSVQKRLHSDRSIGCLLSGGLDSSIITYILTQLLGPKNVRTYSIGMEGSIDLKYARQVADFLGTQHTEVLFTPEEGIKAIPRVVEILESYDITTIRASVGMYLLSEYISKNTKDKVLFSGEGSDELLCGYLYFHNAPSVQEANIESLRLIKNLHIYDVLRADKCISSNGLELREPFLDIDFVNFTLTLTPEIKAPCNNYEKFILRKSFEQCLPDKVLWRRKDGFSDGVSNLIKPWYEYIQDFVFDKVTDRELMSKEQIYYLEIFKTFFPTYQLKIDMWLPKWSTNKDPSGRQLKFFDENI